MSQIIESKEERRFRLNREGQRRYRLRHPDRVKEIQKRCYDKLRKDPERVENYRSYHREWIKNARLEDLAYRIASFPAESIAIAKRAVLTALEQPIVEGGPPPLQVKATMEEVHARSQLSRVCNR